MGKVKRIYHVLLCFFIVFATMTYSKFNVEASTVTKAGETGYYHTGTAIAPNGDRAWFVKQAINDLHVDGKQAFCIEPWYLVNGMSGYTPSQYQNAHISNIVYAGYFMSNRTMLDIATTQVMIWETLGYHPSVTIPNYEKRKAQINARISKLWTVPSFHDQTITLHVGESVTLKDVNNVLTDFKGEITNIDGVKLTRNGNELTLLATEKADEKGIIEMNKFPLSMHGASLIHRKSGSQSIVQPLRSEPVKLHLNINVNKYGSIKLAKQDELGTYIPNTTFKVSYHEDMSDPIGEFTTGEDGTVLVEEVLPKKVYIQEIFVPEPLILDNTIKSVTVTTNNIVSYTALNNIQKGQITVIKQDVLTKDEAQGEATLEGAEFDVYNADKTKVVDHLDENRYTTNALPLGKYYIKETKAPKGYNLNQNYKPVELQYAGQLANISLSNVIVEDKVIEGKIAIHKTTEDMYDTVVDGEGFVFEITEDETGNIVDTLITDEKGYAQSISLPYGHYTINEVEKEGYVVQDDIQVFINEEQKVYEFDIHNKLKDYIIQIHKVDSITKEAIIHKEFEFTRFRDEDCTQEIDKAWIHKDKGVAYFDNVHYGVFYIKETKAPIGYSLSDEVIKIEVNDEGVFMDDKKIEKENDVYSFIYKNTLIPTVKTGDETNLSNLLWMLNGSGILMLGMIFTIKSRRSKMKNK